MSTGYILSLKHILYAKQSTVFNALTDPALIKKWSLSNGEIKAEKEFEFFLFDGWASGIVLSFEKNKRLELSWKSKDWPKKAQASKVIIQLNEHAAGTEVILNHSELPSSKEIKNYKNGWIDQVLEPLNDYFSFQLVQK